MKVVKKMFNNIIIGAGAAGLFLASLINSRDTLVIEKNPYPGKKLNITGKGRCNITNIANYNEFLNEIFTNKKFFYSAFSDLNNLETIKYFNELGLETKVERGGRVFPVSDRARDVTDTLYKHSKCKFNFNERVLDFEKLENGFKVFTSKGIYETKHLVIATGGMSYPSTGSNGDGYKLLEKFGHSIIKPKAALVGLETDSSFKSELMGISLRNVEISLVRNKKTIKKEFGEALFTHYGFSGPIILRLSAFVKDGDILSLDLKPALDHEKLIKRIQRELDEAGTKMIKNSLNHLLLSNMILPILECSKIKPEKESNVINKMERDRLANTIKSLRFGVIKRRPIDEAIITDGGINIREINPSSMESKLVNGLYIIGEILDIAANTGGYNLQIAFSTAFKVFKELEEKHDCD